MDLFEALSRVSLVIEERMNYLCLKDLWALGIHYGMNLNRIKALPSH